LPALALVIAYGRDQLAAIIHASRVVKEAVPVVAFSAAIHQVARHNVKRRVRPVAKGVLHECSPAIQSVLRVAHIDE
jgi:hypothetical protein